MVIDDEGNIVKNDQISASAHANNSEADRRPTSIPERMRWTAGWLDLIDELALRALPDSEAGNRLKEVFEGRDVQNDLLADADTVESLLKQQLG